VLSCAVNKKEKPVNDFVKLLKKLLVAENNKTEEEAERIVNKHPNIVAQGIMSNRLRATVMALEMAEDKKAR
jgi:hypothetical protein